MVGTSFQTASDDALLAEYQKQLRNLLRALVRGSENFTREQIQAQIDYLQCKINKLIEKGNI